MWEEKTVVHAGVCIFLMVLCLCCDKAISLRRSTWNDCIRVPVCLFLLLVFTNDGLEGRLGKQTWEDDEEEDRGVKGGLFWLSS